MRIFQKWGFAFLAVGLLLVGTGCNNQVAGSGQYYACAPASVGDADERCRDGYTCREVEGNSACVPEEEADQFPMPSEGDAGMDAGDAEDAGDVSPQDTRDGDDGNTNMDADDTGDAADGERDTGSSCGLEDATISFEVDSQTLSPDSRVRAPATVTLVIDNAPDWLIDDPSLVEVGVEAPSYPNDALSISQQPAFSPVGGDLSAQLPVHRIGEYKILALVQRDENCSEGIEIRFTAVPFILNEPPTPETRCVYTEFWWLDEESDQEPSHLTFDEPVFDSIRNIQESSSAPGPDIHVVRSDQNLAHSDPFDIGINPSQLSDSRDIFLRIFTYSDPDRPVSTVGTIDPDRQSTFYQLGSFEFGEESMPCHNVDAGVVAEEL
ncbi:MAG: hypothetical protein ACQEVA_17605 [Myxococcota bacterium]